MNLGSIFLACAEGPAWHFERDLSWNFPLFDLVGLVFHCGPIGLSLEIRKSLPKSQGHNSELEDRANDDYI